jgi:hypothetical protein
VRAISILALELAPAILRVAPYPTAASCIGELPPATNAA